MYSKAVLIYYSPTRSTAKLCRAFAEGLGLPVKEYDLTLPGGRIQKIELEKDEVAVIGTPVYGGRAHKFVIDALKQIQPAEASGKEKTPAVLISVYGNRHYDMSFVNLYEAAREAGLAPAACAAYLAEHSFTKDILPGMPDAGELSLAKEHGKRVLEQLKSGADICLREEDIPQRPVDIDMIKMHGVRLMGLKPNRPFPNEKCIQCGACAKVCPMGLIDPNDSNKIEENCVKCFACVKVCPVGAMGFPQEDVKIVAEDCIEHFGRDNNAPKLWLRNV